MKAEELMVKKIEFIDADAPVYDAIEKMIDKRLRSLVVKPKDEKDTYGVITARDIVFKVIGKNIDVKKINVEEIAEKPLICINRTMELEHIINLLKNYNISRAFVCDGVEVVGVVALLDVMGAALIQKAKGS
ncbi:MAG: CBS domain-containing protein [Nitrospirota bacterium]|nr:CBS domain-containing protein [Nitrospirota bacterium]MDH5767500.1 CBS domain-containing protein [Nitrospirota bacterium]